MYKSRHVRDKLKANKTLKYNNAGDNKWDEACHKVQLKDTANSS